MPLSSYVLLYKLKYAEERVTECNELSLDRDTNQMKP